MANNNPSLNPADNDSLVGLLNLSFSKLLQSTDGVLPAQVIAFKSGAPNSPDTVQVQPLINLLGTNGETMQRAQIASVPVIQIGGGGYVLRFNLKPGDQGLIIACDRDISLYMQSGQYSPPNTLRKKDFADSFFLPFVRSGYTIASEDSNNAVLQLNDGSIKISLFTDKIKITGNTEFVNDVLIDGNLTVNGDLMVLGKSTVIGDFASGGNITAAGSITPFTPIPP